MIFPPKPYRAWPALWACVAAIAFVAVVAATGKRLIDLQVFSLAADALIDGGPLYTDTVDPGRFLYPPFGALAYVPFGLFPWPVEQVLWTFAGVLALVLFWRISLQPMRIKALWFAVIVAASFVFDPVWHNFRFGNVSLVLALVVLADLAGPVGARRRGLLTGLAIGIKLTPLVFLPFLVVTRQWRALGNACAVFTGTVAVGFAIRPRESMSYWTGMVLDDSRYPYLGTALNQSINGLLLRWTGGVGSVPVWALICSALGVLCLVAARLWWFRGERALAVSLVAMIALFAAPLTWLHHWVWFIPLAVGLYRASTRASVRPRVAIGIALAWVLVFARGPQRWVPSYDWISPDKPELQWSAGQFLIGHSYLVAAVVALGYLIVVARRVPAADDNAAASRSASRETVMVH